MKKRILSVLLAFAMIFSLMPTALAAPTTYQVVTVDKTNVQAGETVNVKVTLPNITEKAGSFTVNLKFDTALFEVVSRALPPQLSAYNEGFSAAASVDIVANPPADANTSGELTANASYTYNTMEVAGVTVIDATLKAKASGVAAFSFTTFEITKSESGSTVWIVKDTDLETPPSVTIPKAPITSVSAKVDAPQKGVTLDTSVDLGSATAYNGAVEWYKGNTATGAAVTGPAAANQVYTAKITLTAKTADGESFDASLNGQTTAEDYKIKFVDAGKLELTKTFDATAIKDTPTITTVPTASAITYGQKLSNSTLTGGEAKVGSTVISGTFKWKTGTITPQVKDSSSTEYEVVFTPSDVASYETTTCKVKLTVNKKALSSLATDPISDQPYTGSPITPTFRVMNGTDFYEILATSDYEVIFTNNTNVGTANYTIKETPTGNYKFNTSYGTFKIKAADSSISITGDPSKTYDGNVVTDPAVSKSGSTGAVTYTYYTDAACTTKTTTASGAASDGAAPKNAGDYWVKATVPADGSYGSATSDAKKFTISQRNISEVTVASIADEEYTGSSIEPTLTVTYNGAPLTFGTDCTVEYTSNLNVGTATATIKAKTGGNFIGEKAVTFEIKAKAITPVVTVTGSYEYTGDPITPTYKVEITSGGMELPTNQYDAEVSNNTNAGNGNIKITAKANGNYSFSDVNKTFTITAKNVSGLTATISDQTTIKGVGEFVDPVIKGVKGEDLTGTLTYAYDGVSGKSHAEVVTMLKGKNVNDVVTLNYTFAPSPGNYTGTKTGSFKVTVKDIEFLVGTAPASVANALDIKTDPTYGDDWSKIVKIKDGVTITAKVGTNTDTDQSHFTLRPTGKPNAGNGQTYELVYNGTINSTTYTNVVVVSDTVDVARKDVTAAMIAGIPAQTYTGSAIQPKPAVTDGVALVEGTDFTYSYDVNTDVATGGKVTITGQGNYKGTADKTFTISPKNINGATISLASASLPYNGLEQTVSITSVTLTGWTITAGDYDIVGGGNKATNVGSTTLTIQGKGNYSGTATTTWNITAIDPTLTDFDVTPTLPAAQTYDGAHKTVTVGPKSGVNGMGTVKVYYEATADITYPKSETAPTDMGTYKVTASVAAGSNYNAKDIDVGTLTINKATGGTLAAYNFQQKYTDLTAKTITPNYSDLPAGQTWTYSVSAPVTSGTAAVTGTSIGADTGVLSYTLTAGAKDNTVKWTVTISSHNYADFTKEVTLTLTDKDDQTALTITGGTTVVYGQTLQLGTSGGSGTGAVTYAVTNGTGEATIDATGKLTPVKVGTVKVTATKAGDASYNSITSAEVEIHITRATPTGTPKYTAITTSGKTLAEAGLTTTGSNLSVPGTVKWVDDTTGADLPATTTVEANKLYKWVFTPNDSANYTTLTGSIELYHKSSSGGGGWYYTYYTIKATAGTNGSISPSGWTSVRDGRDQTFTITPDKGYAVAKVLVDGKSVGAVKSYTFKNVTKDHTIEAIFMKSNGNPQTGVFVDVAEGSYYEEAIDWAVEKGITNGVSSNMFAPNDPCTRAQIVTFLWRAAGSPALKSMSSFTDVPADAFYAKAVAWAVENGITSGTGESKFSPNATCTRAQAVTFLYRASGSPAVSDSAEFSDVATNAYYADAVAWAAKKGITTGIGGGLFGSDNDCTRGQIVTFLWRAMAE